MFPIPLPNLRIIFPILLTAYLPINTSARSWAPPHSFETLSPSGEHRITVHAPVKASNTKSRIVVKSKLAGRWTKQWTRTVVNEVMPRKAFLNDAGTRVVTMGNWYGTETKADSLVVYKSDGVLARFSIAKLAGPEAILPLSSAGAAWLDDYHAGFDEQLGFYLWLDFARQWVVIDPVNGTLRKLNPELISKCEERARKSLLPRITAGKPSFTDYQLLSRFLRAEDSPLYQRLLSHAEDSLGCGTVHQSNKNAPDYGLIEYYQANRYRQLAEDSLDALAKGNSDAGYNHQKKEDYKRLGNLQLTAHFDHLPKKNDGSIIIWLEPVLKEGQAPKKARPAHALGISLRWNAPERYGVAPDPGKVALPINFYGVTPGQFRVRGFWSKKTKQPNGVKADFWTRTGEHTVVDAPALEIGKGLVSKAVIQFRERVPSDKE